jgi:hypothetical protein
VSVVAVFDFEHGQAGVAANAIELHPILGFDCLTGSASAAGSAGSGSSGDSKASAGVRLVQVTSPVSAGSEASLTVVYMGQARRSARARTHEEGEYPRSLVLPFDVTADSFGRDRNAFAQDGGAIS